MTLHRDVECAGAEHLIRVERQRQVDIGYTPDKDRDRGIELEQAALAYMSGDSLLWPWAREFWKPRTHVENLLRAGALHLAAVEQFEHELADLGATRARERALDVAWMLQQELNAAFPMSVRAIIAGF